MKLSGNVVLYSFALFNIPILILHCPRFLDRDMFVPSWFTLCRHIYCTSIGSLPIPGQSPSAFLPSLSLGEFIPVQSDLFCPLPYIPCSKQPDGVRQENTGFDSCAAQRQCLIRGSRASCESKPTKLHTSRHQERQTYTAQLQNVSVLSSQGEERHRRTNCH